MKIERTLVKTVEEKDGIETPIELLLLKTTGKLEAELDRIYSKEFFKAQKEGLPMAAHLIEMNVKEGLWDEEKAEKVRQLAKNLAMAERKLAEGGISLWGIKNPESAQSIAIQAVRDRNEISNLQSGRTVNYEKTADAHAETVKFNHQVAAITTDTSRNLYFKTVDQYVNSLDTKLGRDVTTAAMKWIYGDGRRNNFEYVFLAKHKMVNEDLCLINKEGKLIDTEGNLISEEGFLLNAEGERVDRDGNRVDEKGNFVVDAKPFLDDDGSEIPSE